MCQCGKRHPFERISLLKGTLLFLILIVILIVLGISGGDYVVLGWLFIESMR